MTRCWIVTFLSYSSLIWYSLQTNWTLLQIYLLILLELFSKQGQLPVATKCCFYVNIYNPTPLVKRCNTNTHISLCSLQFGKFTLKFTVHVVIHGAQLSSTSDTLTHVKEYTSSRQIPIDLKIQLVVLVWPQITIHLFWSVFLFTHYDVNSQRTLINVPS